MIRYNAVFAVLALGSELTFASLTYYAGNLELRQIGDKKPGLAETVYLREIKEDTKEVLETSDLAFDGERFKEVFTYDHKTGTLRVTDREGKLISSSPFSCEGTFPKLKSCRYSFTSSMEVRGEDTYLPNSSIRFNGTTKDFKTGKTWVTDGQLNPVSVEQYKKVQRKIEKVPFRMKD